MPDSSKYRRALLKQLSDIEDLKQFENSDLKFKQWLITTEHVLKQVDKDFSSSFAQELREINFSYNGPMQLMQDGTTFPPDLDATHHKNYISGLKQTAALLKAALEILDLLDNDNQDQAPKEGLLNTNELQHILNLVDVDQITPAIQDSFDRKYPYLFNRDGLCSGYPLVPAPDEYFVAHEVSPEKIADLRHALEQGLATTELKPYTADQDIQPGHVLCKIAAKIQTTTFCLFDLPEAPNTFSAANVYLELGIAVGLGRPFILIKNDKVRVPSLLEGLDTFGFSSYSGLRRKIGEQVKIGQFSTILPQEDIQLDDTYFIADGEVEQEDFREAIYNALVSYKLQPVYLGEGQVEPALVLTQLIRSIQATRFGIYRIDQQSSANTFLALGVAIGLNRPWLLVAREGATIPENVRGLSNFNFRSFIHLETEFSRRCEEFLKKYALELDSLPNQRKKENSSSASLTPKVSTPSSPAISRPNQVHPESSTAEDIGSRSSTGETSEVAKPQPIVFIAYAQNDEKEKDQLLSHMGVLQRAGLIEVWSEDRIKPGADWESEINEVMTQAGVAILLISVHFLNSDFIMKKIVPTLLEYQKSKNLVIVPIIAKPCAWQMVSWLVKMEVRPRDKKSVWRKGARHADEELTAIAEEIAAMIADRGKI